MGSGFSSVLHPSLGGWDERAFRPSRGNRAALSGFVMMSTRSPEGNPLTTLTTAPREEASGVCVFRGGSGNSHVQAVICHREGWSEGRGDSGDLREVQLTRQLGPLDLSQSIVWG